MSRYGLGEAYFLTKAQDTHFLYILCIDKMGISVALVLSGTSYSYYTDAGDVGHI